MEIAERFNEYFINSIRDIRISIENVHYENNVRTSNYRLYFRAISLNELENICRNMRKKKDYRRTPIGISLDDWNAVGNILLRIINRSLETGIFLEDWKESMVTPVEKIRNTIK